MDISQATLITNEEYLSLVSPIFQSQTRLSKDGTYRMYWLSEDKLYYTVNHLL